MKELRVLVDDDGNDAFKNKNHPDPPNPSLIYTLPQPEHQLGSAKTQSRHLINHNRALARSIVKVVEGGSFNHVIKQPAGGDYKSRAFGQLDGNQSSRGNVLEEQVGMLFGHDYFPTFV